MLVTGASRGIGAAIAERLRRDGWQVETAERASGVDLADPDAAAKAVERLDRIDALVANAGVLIRKPRSSTRSKTGGICSTSTSSPSPRRRRPPVAA